MKDSLPFARAFHFDLWLVLLIQIWVWSRARYTWPFLSPNQQIPHRRQVGSNKLWWLQTTDKAVWLFTSPQFFPTHVGIARCIERGLLALGKRRKLRIHRLSDLLNRKGSLLSISPYWYTRWSAESNKLSCNSKWKPCWAGREEEATPRPNVLPCNFCVFAMRK